MRLSQKGFWGLRVLIDRQVLIAGHRMGSASCNLSMNSSRLYSLLALEGLRRRGSQLSTIASFREQSTHWLRLLK